MAMGCISNMRLQLRWGSICARSRILAQSMVNAEINRNSGYVAYGCIRSARIIIRHLPHVRSCAVWRHRHRNCARHEERPPANSGARCRSSQGRFVGYCGIVVPTTDWGVSYLFATISTDHWQGVVKQFLWTHDMRTEQGDWQMASLHVRVRRLCAPGRDITGYLITVVEKDTHINGPRRAFFSFRITLTGHNVYSFRAWTHQRLMSSLTFIARPICK